jgi:acetaldehyde dehydrogenase (acetylating)
MSARSKAASIGSGNIGTDLMIKVIRLSSRPPTSMTCGASPARSLRTLG